MENKMTNKEFYKAFLVMTITVALQNLIVYGVNLADSVMMGAYSETALSGVGVCNNIQYLLFMAVTGVTNGTTVIASRYWGMRNIKSVNRISSIAMILGLGISAFIFILCAIMPERLIYLFTDKETVASEAIRYLIIIKYTYIIFGITQVMLAILRSVETVKIGFYVSLSSFAINVILNWILIYGKFGCPEMGIRGAAYATLISRVIEFIVVVTYTFFFDKKIKFKPSTVFKADKEIFREYIKTGSPLLASSVSWGIAMSIQGAIIGRLVESAIAANSIASTLFQIASVITYASGNAACVLTAKTIGERSGMDVIKKRTKGLQYLFIAIGILSSVLLLGIKSFIIGFYDASPDTVKYTTQFTIVLMVTIIGTSYECPCLCGIVSGGGETNFVFKNDIIFMWLIVLPISALSAFYFKWPVVVTFACLKADQVLKCPVAYFKTQSYNWVKTINKDEEKPA